MSARIRKATAAGIVAAALALTGCTASGWVPQAPPAAGSQAELPSRDKARNVLFVVDDKGKGVLIGTLTTVDGTQLQALHYTPEKPDGSKGQPQIVEVSKELRPGKALRFEEVPVQVSDPNLSAGHLATLELKLSTGDIKFDVPVYANDHQDFKDVWAEATK
ncbi:hypothetical protein [Tessaracoccus sp. OH4464_COT-324]|uniref:hypothetical protein n=1 Tax=Tessaracoccus sp. OH4464_COT-324 TaxID=2491059 RepID=UPI000F64373E|nr:hypothetical protein [Tessaracoccus sp. OH4464_COT-324]RRD46753.1 hypothetical protein EII42_05875 [Tessaracoccus sp. OH4464_COT-324]